MKMVHFSVIQYVKDHVQIHKKAQTSLLLIYARGPSNLPIQSNKQNRHHAGRLHARRSILMLKKLISMNFFSRKFCVYQLFVVSLQRKTNQTIER